MLFGESLGVPNAKSLSAPIRGEAAVHAIYAIEQWEGLASGSIVSRNPDDRDNYFGNRATQRLQASAATEDGRRIIDPRARAYRDQAKRLWGARYLSERPATKRSGWERRHPSVTCLDPARCYSLCRLQQSSRFPIDTRRAARANRMQHAPADSHSSLARIVFSAGTMRARPS